MGIIYGAISSALRWRKNKKVGMNKVDLIHPIHACTKEQHLRWVEEGKCQCCGAESGEYKGICDECRLS